MPSSSESAKMASYKLSQAADEDFENIFDYGIDTFGLEQAVVYQTGMKMRFDEMAENPMLYNAVDHIKQGYRRSVFAAHSIYYTVENDGIKIIRILGRQGPNKALSEQEGAAGYCDLARNSLISIQNE